MDLPRTYLICGRSFSLHELLRFARMRSEDPASEQWEKEVYSFIFEFLKGIPRLEQYTSGTTGKSKRVLLERSAMMNAARASLDYFRLGYGKRVLLCLPVKYIAGKMLIVRALIGGLDLYMVEPSERPLKSLERPMDMIPMVPLQFFETLKHKDPLYLVNSLLIGGGEIHPSTMSKIKKTVSCRIFESFAMSETYSHFAIRQLNGEKQEEAFTVLEGVKIRQDERNCLVVDFPGVTRGEIVTNDLVRMEGERQFTWLGRIDNVINSGGIKLVPEILEKKIRTLIDRELVLIGVSDARLGQKLVLVIEDWREDNEAAKKWLDKLSEILAKHEIPKEILPMEKLPRNAAMKIDRKAIRKALNN